MDVSTAVAAVPVFPVVRNAAALETRTLRRSPVPAD